MGADRYFLMKELTTLGRALREEGVTKSSKARLARLEVRVSRSVDRRKYRQEHLPRPTYPDSLPISAARNEIVNAIRNHRVIVVTGETGSGKTTQIPKMCLEAGRGGDGMIGCTQPRRIAAVTVSRRIAEELGEPPGRSVGYKIRFEDRTNPLNCIKVMTDGVLLMETQADPFLNAYDTIIVDEAHERSINIDFILGILKRLLTKRSDLRLIITSATIDPARFSRAFHNAPIIEVSGRMFPVEVRYRPVDPELEERGEVTYIDHAVSAVGEIRKTSRAGDILIFMPTEQDIRETCDRLAGRKYLNTAVIPLFGRLSTAEQQRVFAPCRDRKIIVATNVAETSITIPGIQYVIDTGLARISEYNPVSRVKRLPVKAVSQSSAVQRGGRCGRVQKGVCVRLYSEEDFLGRPPFTTPEILRSNLAEVILRMTALNIGAITDFPFIDPPSQKSIGDGLNILKELGAVTTAGARVRLTATGKRMAQFPLDPRISRMIIEAEKEGCVDEVLIIASALSIQEPRERPLENTEAADAVHASFADPASDFITYLNIWKTFNERWAELRTQNRMRKFCREHFLSYRRMREWRDIYDQISAVLDEMGIKRERSAAGRTAKSLHECVHRAILSGYLSSIAVKKEQNIYQSAKGKEVMIFPGSALFNRAGTWIVSAEIVETSRTFARIVATVQSEWIEKAGGGLCRRTYRNPRWDRGRGEVVATARISLFGLVIDPERTVTYGPVNPTEATAIFIREALVTGDLNRSFPFLEHNRTLIDKAAAMEDKLRRRNILVSPEDFATFYEERVGVVYDEKTLARIVADRGNTFLTMQEEDVVRRHPGSELIQYPDAIDLEGKQLACEYRFAPGTEEDGVTVKVPSFLARKQHMEEVDWKIPGFLKEKISSLIKGLPKEYRRKLVPLPRTVDIIASEIKPAGDSLLASLARLIRSRFGVEVPATAWPVEDLPEHVKIRFSVIDDRGREIRAGRNVAALEESGDDHGPSRPLRKARVRWEREGIVTWDLGDLPEWIEVSGQRDTGHLAFPALEAEDDRVNLRLFESRDRAESSHAAGVAALYRLHFAKELRHLRRSLTLPAEMKKPAQYFGGPGNLEEMLYRQTTDILFARPVRRQEDFFSHARAVQPEILVTGQELLREIEPVLRAYHETRTLLSDLEQANAANRAVRGFIEELRGHVDRLVPENFPERYGRERLAVLPRYLQGITIRARRGMHHLEKDRGKAEKLKVYAKHLETIMETIPPFTSPEKQAAIEELSWMLEEYRISLFAPEMKTLYPVSPKRLNEKIKEIEQMI
ncbi:MAG: ATP-dependent RNA helicase HrpA [Deltaproteobacteria bacterium]|nr:ATP-dependent RNA helicase HrpA [Deltaproteobacteria bacterium]